MQALHMQRGAHIPKSNPAHASQRRCLLHAPARRRALLPMLRAYGSTDPFTDPFTAMDAIMGRQMEFMDAQMRQMDRDMADMMSQARQAELQAQAQAERAAQEALRYERVNDQIQIRRGEERGAGSYRYYESISIQSGPGYHVGITQQPIPATGVSPLVIGAAILAGFYAVVAAAFARAFDLTVYNPKYRPLMALAWPILFPFSSKFRTQFLCAIRGKRAPLPGKEEEQQQQQQQQQQQ